ncbi:hypothetical protein [Novacetimonas hansenii]|uniref:hypothetical protein n=1 Tax=Novacetimonas hansenii TaxID=436 RepID=UPI00248EABD7|nr:hypothetical protein [Novacetimonas hansenii]
MTATANWPDPNRPGAPMFPEQDGWHVMEGICGGQTALTHWNGREWGGGEQVRSLNTSPERYRYVGAVYTPAQVSALLVAERERVITEALPKILIDLAELPDRTSPDNAPDLLMATAHEIETLAQENIRNLGAAS